MLASRSPYYCCTHSSIAYSSDSPVLLYMQSLCTDRYCIAAVAAATLVEHTALAAVIVHKLRCAACDACSAAATERVPTALLQLRVICMHCCCCYCCSLELLAMQPLTAVQFCTLSCAGCHQLSLSSKLSGSRRTAMSSATMQHCSCSHS
jgi:hypothetical protein